jgi:ligand-binding sensor domain-containing protein
MNIKYFIINVLFALLLVSSFVQAADLVFTPATPVVEIGQQITLSVSGTSGEVKWSAQSGWIEGIGTTVTYIAPSQPGKDVVTVMDDEDNVATVKIQINAKPDENAVWEVFTNRDYVTVLALSKDKSTLWVGTDGGLEKRKAHTGELEEVYINTNGLPNNDVRALLPDNQGGIWIGTQGGGIAHLKANSSWEFFNTATSNLPDNNVRALLFDDQGGIWIGTHSGLAHMKVDSSWEIYLPRNVVTTLLSDELGGIWIGTDSGVAHLKTDFSWEVSEIVDSNGNFVYVYALLSDNQGGIWIGTQGEGLVHLKADFSREVTDMVASHDDSVSINIHALVSDNQGDVWVGTWGGGLVRLKTDSSWEVFYAEKSNLPSNSVSSLLSDDQGGIWIGTYGGLVHLKADGTWQVFKTEHANLPDNNVLALSSDVQGGIWIGTVIDGLAHRKADSSWEVFNTDNSKIPSNSIKALLSDDQGGVWIGTSDVFVGYDGDEGIAHLKADGTWQVFNIDNSNLPSNDIRAILSDNQGGVWIGTLSGLTLLKTDGSWQVFNTDNSNLPSNKLYVLLSDDKGGIWIGTGEGIAHFKADSTWNIFNTDNSNLPDNSVSALLSDEQGGVWIGTEEGLAHLKAEGFWQVFNEDNSKMPSNSVMSLLSDNQGGVWVGIYEGGLANLKADSTWQVFDTNNSNLPNNDVMVLHSDDQAGIWIGTLGRGLAHLTPGEQQSGKRAAIIIAGGGNQATNSLWDTTESISTYFYKMLNKRKFVNSEIYYLSSHPWADFNGDGFDDKIVDAPRPVRPINQDDIKQAFDWAKDQGKLDQPLYVFFIDHGGEGKLQLAKNTNMAAEEFKVILDDYQQTTGNQVVAIIEACYSGSHLPILKAPNRAIISSARDNELAYFEGKQGFSRFFTKSLLKSMNFLEAFDYSVQKQSRMLTKMDERLSGGSAEHIATTQTPQFDDNSDGVYTKDSDGQWLKQLRINGNIQTGDFTLAVESLTTSSTIQVGQPFSLRAKATTASGLVKRVWAVIRPPRINLVIDSNGTPILAYPTEELSSTEEADIWAGTWNQAVYNGDYEISFYTKDNEGNIEMSEESVVISVTGGVEPPASASVDIVVEKERYARGESFKFELVEQLGWGYDLYAAVVLPDGQFMTLEGPNKLAKLNQPEKWYKSRKYSEKVTAIDMTLPTDLATGKYCLYGILSPQREEPLEVMDKWVYSQQCFEVM